MNTHRSSPAVLIISHDVVGAQMAGPGIRYWRLASVLAQEGLSVTLAVPQAGDEPAPAASHDPVAFSVVTYTPAQWSSLSAQAAQADACLLPGDTAAHFADELAAVEAALIIDGYDPVLAEWLAVHNHISLADLPDLWQERLARQTAQFRLGDFFICASERQRDWWLGQLEAWGRINPATYRADPSLHSLVEVVPYGLPAEPPQARAPVIRGVWPGIAREDELILWGGGLWPWLDPLTAIRAMPQVLAQRPRARLIFPGTRHPNPEMATMPSLVNAAKTLAAQLDLTGRAVFFGDWVDYADWPGVLLESSLALSLHHDTIETRLAFRSRHLETIWAGLPTVTTGGDATSDLVASYGLGEVAPPGDTGAVAAAILRQLAHPPSAQHFGRARADLTWERAAAPLLAFCRAPRRAPDRAAVAQSGGGAHATPWQPAFASTPSSAQNKVAREPASSSTFIGTTPTRTTPARATQAQTSTQASDELEEARAEAAYWRDLAQRYAQGRVMRLLAWLSRLQARLRRKP